MTMESRAYVETTDLQERDLRDFILHFTGVLHVERTGSRTYTVQFPASYHMRNWRELEGDQAVRVEFDSLLALAAGMLGKPTIASSAASYIDLQDLADFIMERVPGVPAISVPVDTKR